MVVIRRAELNGRTIRVGVLRQLADLRLCEDADVDATKRRHLVLQQRLSTAAHQPEGWSGVVFRGSLSSITRKLTSCMDTRV